MFVKQVSALAQILLFAPLRISVTPLVHVILLLELATTLRHLLPKPVTTEIRARKPILVNSVSVLAVILLLVPLRINVTFLELVIPPMEFAITPRHLMAKVVTTEMRAHKPISVKQVSVLALILSLATLRINVTRLACAIPPPELVATPSQLLAKLVTMEMRARKPILAQQASVVAVTLSLVPLRINVTFLELVILPLEFAITPMHLLAKVVTTEMRARKPILAQQVSVLAVTLSVVLLWINVTFLELVILPLEFAITPRHLLAHLAAMAMDVPSQIPAPVEFAFLVLPRSVPLLISATFLAFANHPLVSAPTLPNVMVRSATMVMLARN